MNVKQQQGTFYQLTMFEEFNGEVRPVTFGEDGIGSEVIEERQAFTAVEEQRALRQHLMEQIVDRDNLNRAYKRVKSNKGSPGVDGLTVQELGEWLRNHKDELIPSLLSGAYEPKPVKRVDIPKPGGGVRQLDIPTAVDRFVQQAILQVLDPLIDPTFSESTNKPLNRLAYMAIAGCGDRTSPTPPSPCRFAPLCIGGGVCTCSSQNCLTGKRFSASSHLSPRPFHRH